MGTGQAGGRAGWGQRHCTALVPPARAACRERPNSRSLLQPGVSAGPKCPRAAPCTLLERQCWVPRCTVGSQLWAALLAHAGQRRPPAAEVWGAATNHRGPPRERVQWNAGGGFAVPPEGAMGPIQAPCREHLQSRNAASRWRHPPRDTGGTQRGWGQNGAAGTYQREAGEWAGAKSSPCRREQRPVALRTRGQWERGSAPVCIQTQSHTSLPPGLRPLLGALLSSA